jgi:hypothetical protein
MDKINLVKRKIEGVIKGSSVPEDPIHSKNTLEWLLKLMPDANEGLKIAALGHDIERAIEKRKVRRQDYKDYDAFKDAHCVLHNDFIIWCPKFGTTRSYSCLLDVMTCFIPMFDIIFIIHYFYIHFVQLQYLSH